MSVLVASALFTGTILYWTLQPFGREIVEFPQGLTVVNETVKPGESITIKAPYCKNVKTETTILTRSFQDQITYYIPVQESNVPIGCHPHYTAVIEIPKNLPPDTYTYNMNFTYRVNPIKTVEYSFESTKFIVEE
jgi:hypothetical protein